MWAFVAPAYIPLANTRHATITKITAWKHTTPEVKSMGRYVQASSRKGGKQKPTNNNTTLHLKGNLEVEYPVLSGPLHRIFFFLNLHILVLCLLLISPAQITHNLSF